MRFDNPVKQLVKEQQKELKKIQKILSKLRQKGVLTVADLEEINA